MNRFDNDEFNKEIDYLIENIKSDYIQKVKKVFLERAQKTYYKYKALNNNEILLEMFQSSTFKSLIEEDTTFVIDYDVNYWVEHIIKEINSIVNLNLLITTEDN